MITATFEYKKFNFSAGETQVKVLSTLMAKETICWKYESDAEFMELALLVDAVRSINSGIDLDLCMPYIPYARQDRACVSGEAFSLQVFASLINSLNFREILVMDPHSEVFMKLVPNMVDYLWMYLVELAKMLPDNVLIVAPDKGAAKKIASYVRMLNSGEFKYHMRDTIACDKVRNPENGFITAYSVPETDFSKYDVVLVMDDICDGGMTFNILADSFEHPNKWLYVTHGIFSKGLEELKKRYKKIITTESMVHRLKYKDEVEVLEV